MKYKYLNEVLLDWGNSEENIQDNTIIKSNDIKRQIEQCFIYRVEDEPSRIHIFNVYGQMWEVFEKYKDKVYINGNHIELNNKGETIKYYKPGEYRVYIEDIDQVEDTGYMFYDCPQLIKAYIPNTVTSIGEWVFSCCSGLTSVIIPNSVTFIGNSAFRGSGLTSVTIPNSVTSIDRSAFSGCSGLTGELIIPNSVTSIGDFAFWDCIGLTSLTIGNSVTSIGAKAFRDCSGLTSIIIPKSVTSISNEAFYGCRSIETVYVEDINKFKQIDFGNEYANPTYYGAKLIELQNYEI